MCGACNPASESMTSHWRPSAPALDADTLPQVLRENAVVAIHVWATWNGHDRTFDETLRPLREEFEGRVAFRSIDIDSAAGAKLAHETHVLNVPTLSIWIRGRCWSTRIGVRSADEFRWELGEALRLSASDVLETYVREADVGRLVRWGGSLLGELAPVPSGDDHLVHRDRSGREFSLVPGSGGTDFTVIGIRGGRGTLPFASDVELARAAFGALGVETRAAPGVLAPQAGWTQLWSVSGNGERLVEWWTPENVFHPSHLLDTFTAVGAKPRRELFDDIVERYSEPDRAYHTLLHLSEMYSACMESPSQVERWPEVEIALWFHDAIYDTHRHDNEERSADWARDELLAAGAASEVAARVHALVLATKHRDVPEGNDARFLVDADLSILAAPPDRFATYERQIRQEYEWVPEPEFRAAREKFLRGMLARPSIFNDPAMRERHEAHARRNIEESLRRLGSGAS